MAETKKPIKAGINLIETTKKYKEVKTNG